MERSLKTMIKMEHSKLLQMALSATQRNNDEHERIVKLIKPKHKGVVILKQDSRLCYVLPEGMSNCTLDKIKSENIDKIEEFKNDKEKLNLKL